MAAANKPSVLVLDQLDAVRWSAAHSHRAWQVCQQILDDAARFPFLKVLVSCRRFDLESEPSFRQWAERTKPFLVDVTELDECQAEKEVGANIWRELTVGQQAALRRVLNLQIWKSLRDALGHAPSFATSIDLMKKYWQHAHSQLGRLGNPGHMAETVLHRLTAELQARAELTVSAHVFGNGIPKAWTC
jgi:hypothetical protein